LALGEKKWFFQAPFGGGLGIGLGVADGERGPVLGDGLRALGVVDIGVLRVAGYVVETA
jgi:hypothetical protein